MTQKTIRRHKEKVAVYKSGREFQRNQPCRRLNLGLEASATVRISMSVV